MNKNKAVNTTPKTDLVRTPDQKIDKHDGFLTGFFQGVRKMDGWMNILTGLGRKDKDARDSSVVNWKKMPEYDIENMWAGDAIAAKVIELPPSESLEPGYKITGITESKREQYTTRLKELCFDDRVLDVATKARGYGGAALLKVYDGDDLMLEKPLNPEAKKVLKSLVVMQRFELMAFWEDIEKDFRSVNFRKPRQYRFQERAGFSPMATDVLINRSRLVIFEGTTLPDRLYQVNGFWTDTVLSRVYDAIRNYSFSHDSVNAALKDMSVAVFKVKNLADDLSSDCSQKTLDRMQVVNLSKSIARAVVVDAEGEDFDYKTRTMTGAAELVAKAEDRLAAETSMPKTVLLGISPQGGGLGQSGDHDSENWYNYCEGFRTKKIKPGMLEIIREVAVELGDDPSKVDIEFNPMWQQSEKEIVETREKQANIDDKYINMGVFDPSEVRTSRFGGEKYSIETAIDKSFDEILKQQNDPANDPELNKQVDDLLKTRNPKKAE